jgi:hypothetical protein
MAETIKEALRLREVECPGCSARFLFRRTRPPTFDNSGFESYILDCKSCRILLNGVIDPFSGTLVLSVVCKVEN